MNQLSNLSLLVEKFDQGHEAVYVEDEAGNYQGTIDIIDFWHSFPKTDCTKYVRSFVQHGSSELEDRCQITKLLLNTSKQEAAVLDKGKIVGSGCQKIMGGAATWFDMWDKQHAYWELISEEVAKDFFKERRSILLSSEKGDLQGFKDRFSKMLDIYVYDGTNYDLYLDERIDMFIYGRGIRPARNNVAIYDARQLYSDMLAEELRRYFAHHDIVYYACSVSDRRPAKNQVHRVAPASKGEPLPPFVWSGVNEDYMSLADFTGVGKAKVINGHRQDAPVVDGYERSVFVFGPCTALGSGAGFGETIEACLQANLLGSGRKWRVVNCGANGSIDLNNLYYMIHTPMRQGDVVIHYVFNL